MSLTIRVGFRDYLVRGYTHAEIRSWGVGVRGTITQLPPVIRLDADMPPREQARALIHEILHACYRASGPDRAAMPQEDVCGMLDEGLVGVLLNNVELFGILQRAIHGGIKIVEPVDMPKP